MHRVLRMLAVFEASRAEFPFARRVVLRPAASQHQNGSVTLDDERHGNDELGRHRVRRASARGQLRGTPGSNAKQAKSQSMCCAERESKITALMPSACATVAEQISNSIIS